MNKSNGVSRFNQTQNRKVVHGGGAEGVLPANLRCWLLIAACTMVFGLLANPSAQAATVFINEIHYSNTGIDIGEAIEVAGPAGTDLAGWALVLYNGSNGETYDTLSLAGLLPDQANGFGTLSFAAEGIQNGPNDGIALVDAGSQVVQFLSYEGEILATNGPALGVTSLDIGVMQSDTLGTGLSLQLIGSGSVYGDFSWSSSVLSSFGQINDGQTFAAVPLPSAIVLFAPGLVGLLAFRRSGGQRKA